MATAIVVATSSLTLLVGARAASAQARTVAPTVQSRVVPIIAVDGHRFRDLDRDGKLTPFEDWRLSPEQRARDLVARMTLEEKGGAVVHGTAPIPGGPLGSNAPYDTAALARQIVDRHVNSLITRMALAPSVFAEQSNTMQAIAERGRLGIPVTISTDPRNQFAVVGGASVAASGFSLWPEMLGFGALDDTALVRRFASIARDEYRAVGIHMALSPMADLATEPRWARANGTFGEELRRVAPLVRAYVEGFQGSARGVTRSGVAAVVKHWAGYGAAVDGWDGHSYYGRYSAFPARRFEDHVKAFQGAFDVKVSAVMPTYNILKDVSIGGAPLEQVGAGFNRQLLGTLLRDTYRFGGMVISDWRITEDCSEACRTGTPRQRPQEIAMPWGVESLTVSERYAKAMNAGIDQFGGVDDGAPLVEAVRAGRVAVARLDTAVVRVMTLKFQLGLFDDPYVAPTRAARFVGNAESQRLATRTQARAMVVLENALGRTMLPRAGMRVWSHGMDTAVVRRRGFVVARSADDADVAIVRLAAPFRSEHPGHFFGSFQHEGTLEWSDGDSALAVVREAAAKAPTIVAVYLDRAAVLTPLRPLAKGLVAEFGASDDALLDVLTGRVRAEGRLPFELPSSMAAVRAQSPDAPADSKAPLYPIGYRIGVRR